MRISVARRGGSVAGAAAVASVFLLSGVSHAADTPERGGLGEAVGEICEAPTSVIDTLGDTLQDTLGGDGLAPDTPQRPSHEQSDQQPEQSQQPSEHESRPATSSDGDDETDTSSPVIPATTTPATTTPEPTTPEPTTPTETTPTRTEPHSTVRTTAGVHRVAVGSPENSSGRTTTGPHQPADPDRTVRQESPQPEQSATSSGRHVAQPVPETTAPIPRNQPRLPLLVAVIALTLAMTAASKRVSNSSS